MIFEINKTIFNYLNSLANISWIENIVFLFSDAPIFILPIFLVGMWIYFAYKKTPDKKNILLYIFYSTIIGIIISLTIQQLIQIDRPEDYIKSTGKLLLSHIPDASFPSDHATVSFAFLISLFLAGYKKIGFIILPFMIIMNLSRIIAGVHWPFDILAGFIVGAISSIITFKVIIKLDFLKKVNSIVIKILSLIKL